MNKREIFTLPAQGNSITEIDVKKMQIRVTKDFKKFFPKSDSKLTVYINGTPYVTSFRYREGRSHIWYLGKEIASKIQLKPGSEIVIRKYPDSKFEIVAKE